MLKYLKAALKKLRISTPKNADTMTKVTTSERLWSEEVGIADADSDQHDEPGYGFSNGRRLKAGKGLYTWPQQISSDMSVSTRQSLVTRAAAAVSETVSSMVATAQGHAAAAIAAIGSSVGAASAQAATTEADLIAVSDGVMAGMARQAQGTAALAGVAAGMTVVSTQAQTGAAQATAVSTGEMYGAAKQAQGSTATASVGSGAVAVSKQAQMVSLSGTASTFANLYVATTGSDANPGTAAKPLRTISKAATLANPGDIVSVASGTYNENVAITASGTPSAYITFKSAVKHGAKTVAGNALHSSAFTVKGDYVKVIDFDITGGGAVGLDFQGSYGEAHGNYIHDIPAPGNDGFGGAGLDFSNFPSKTNGIADGNIIARIGGSQVSNKIQGLYAAIPNVTFTNNIVYGVAAYAVNTGHYSINCTIVNNTLFGNGNSGLDSGGIVITATDAGPQSAGHIVRNNIIFNNLGIGIHEEGSQGANVYSNNLVYQNNTNYGNLNGHSNSNNVSANPQFINYQPNGTGDYRLQSGSPAINAGAAAYAPATDLDGMTRAGAPDIGAYEYA